MRIFHYTAWDIYQPLVDSNFHIVPRMRNSCPQSVRKADVEERTGSLRWLHSWAKQKSEQIEIYILFRASLPSRCWNLLCVVRFLVRGTKRMSWSSAWSQEEGWFAWENGCERLKRDGVTYGMMKGLVSRWQDNAWKGITLKAVMEGIVQSFQVYDVGG